MNACNAIPFSVRCLLGFGRGRPGGGRYPTHQASQPATHTNVFAFVCCCFTYIYIYIYIYMLHITDRQTEIDRSLSILSLSLSLHSLGSCCLHTLAPTTTRLASCVCVCVCIWLPFEQCFRRPDNRPHIYYIDRGAEDKQQAHTATTTQTHHDALLGRCCVCVVCIGVSCCEAAVRGGRVEIRAVPPPPACCHKSSRQACRTGTHLPTMLLLLL
jgi:hypothetical protein